MNQRTTLWIACIGLAFFCATQAAAHFQLLIPSPLISMGEPFDLSILFSHPSHPEQVMEMGTPEAFNVTVRGEQTHDLLPTLQKKTTHGKTTYTASYQPEEPGDYTFTLTPAPYFEEAEDTYIQQITKVIANAYDDYTGWDQPAGLAAEILPLSRPYSLYTGNVFQGTVLKDGTPVPHAEIEVEYYNQAGDYTPPTDAHTIQTIKADANGTFTYGLPRAGWWGFSAIGAGGPATHNGKELSVDAVLWVYCEETP